MTIKLPTKLKYSSKKKRQNKLRATSIANATEMSSPASTVSQSVNKQAGAVDVANGSQISVSNAQGLSIGTGNNNPAQGLAGIGRASNFLSTHASLDSGSNRGNGGLVINNDMGVGFSGDSNPKPSFQTVSAVDTTLTAVQGSYTPNHQVLTPTNTVSSKTDTSNNVSLNNIVHPNPLREVSNKAVDNSGINASSPPTDIQPNDNE